MSTALIHRACTRCGVAMNEAAALRPCKSPKGHRFRLPTKRCTRLVPLIVDPDEHGIAVAAEIAHDAFVDLVHVRRVRNRPPFADRPDVHTVRLTFRDRTDATLFMQFATN